MQKLISLLIAAGVVIGLSTTAMAEDRRVSVTNHGHKRIVGLYASPIDEGKWTYNMLQGQAIRHGETKVADFDDQSGYCRFDLLAVDAAGNRAIRMDTNVCTMQSWDLYDE